MLYAGAAFGMDALLEGESGKLYPAMPTEHPGKSPY